eukprot:929217-Pyramimonas_sp.AAC.1
MVTCGLLPAGAYASEIEGPSNNYLEQLRSIELSASGPKCKGKSRAVTFALYGCKSGKWALGPVIRWAKEVWAVSIGKAAPM